MADIGLTPNSTIPAKYVEDDAPFEVQITSTQQIGRGGTACVIQGEIFAASPAQSRLVALKIFTTAVDSKDETVRTILARSLDVSTTAEAWRVAAETFSSMTAYLAHASFCRLLTPSIIYTSTKGSSTDGSKAKTF